MISKPNVGGGVSHPARYSSNLLPVFERHLEGFDRVLDPFAGTGQRLEPLLASHDLVGVELEPEWASVSDWVEQGNALALRFDDATFDAICTSPTYGNRLADHHNAKDPESRRSYTHDLGRTLDQDNSGVLHWGDEYRAFHERAWLEAIRVLRPGGRFVLNIKDHIRGGKPQYVSRWHVVMLQGLGLVLVTISTVETPALRAGRNATARVAYENVAIFDKPR